MKKILLLSAILISCAVHDKYFVKITVDEFDKNTRYEMKGNILCAENKLEALRLQIDLQLLRIDKPDTSLLFFVVHYSGENWIHIINGESMAFLIDKKLLKLDGAKNINKDQMIGGWVHEYAYYPIPPSLLLKIISANEVKVKISGESDYIKRFITPRVIEKFARFYREYGNK